jgi:putative transposase
MACLKRSDLANRDICPRFTQPRRQEAVEFATLAWVDWFNHRLLLEPIGNIPPAKAEQRYFALLDQMKIAA